MSFPDVLLAVIKVIGIASFAVAGSLVAINRELDLFGVVLMGMVTALGGGVLRDVLLGALPPWAFSNFLYLSVAGLTSFLVFVLMYILHKKEIILEKIDRVNNLVDALGLGVFTATGTQVVMDTAFSDNPFICVFLGMLTAVGGGLLRDIMCDTVPFILKKRIYAIAALAGSLTYYLLSMTVLRGIPNIALTTALVFTIRVLATRYKWSFPRITLKR
ncbi:MAG: trimeric intracellular cation channel family protein [Eubacteriales bacterium]